MALEVPAPRHLSTTSTPLTNHCIYLEEAVVYTDLYKRFPPPHPEFATIVGRDVASVVPPSSFIQQRVMNRGTLSMDATITAESQSKIEEPIIHLTDAINSKIDRPDSPDAEKLHPSGYTAPGWKWNSFRTPSAGKRVVDCRLHNEVLPEKTSHKIERLLEISQTPVPHPGMNYDHPSDVSTDTIVQNADEFYTGGLVPGDFPGYYCAAEYAGPRFFLNQPTTDQRGTALILPIEVNSDQFLTSQIGKMFVHVQNRRQLNQLLNKGFNCLVTCAHLGAYALKTYPAINFNPRLFRVSKGVHCYNPEGVKIQVILLLLYYQNTTLLTLFERCRWIIGSDIEELDSGANHPT